MTKIDTVFPRPSAAPDSTRWKKTLERSFIGDGYPAYNIERLRGETGSERLRIP